MAITNFSLTSSTYRNHPSASLTCSLNSSPRSSSPDSVFLPDATGPSYNPLVYQAVKLLGPPATFDASKLEVIFKGEEKDQYRRRRILPRTYNLSHCDFTADLTLTISNVLHHDQVPAYFLNFPPTTLVGITNFVPVTYTVPYRYQPTYTVRYLVLSLAQFRYIYCVVRYRSPEF
ncbi:putative staygreen protein [Helianthus annuus]|nr:putative staygreen protein [Helianthus annuus]